ncbi:MAG: SHOCT domain-containing protein [Candidatus Cybelea sp.]
MRRRFGRPSLLGTAARTAVIAGTATATMNAVGGAGRRGAPAQAEPPAPAAAPQNVALMDESIAKLKELGDLHAAGVLTDQEFAQAKAKWLGLG